MTTASAALLVVDLLLKGPALYGAAMELATLIKAADGEGRDLTKEEVAPYFVKLDEALDRLEEVLK